jgi:hypothetical protein
MTALVRYLRSTTETERKPARWADDVLKLVPTHSVSRAATAHCQLESYNIYWRGNKCTLWCGEENCSGACASPRQSKQLGCIVCTAPAPIDSPPSPLPGQPSSPAAPRAGRPCKRPYRFALLSRRGFKSLRSRCKHLFVLFIFVLHSQRLRGFLILSKGLDEVCHLFPFPSPARCRFCPSSSDATYGRVVGILWPGTHQWQRWLRWTVGFVAGWALTYSPGARTGGDRHW